MNLRDFIDGTNTAPSRIAVDIDKDGEIVGGTIMLHAEVWMEFGDGEDAEAGALVRVHGDSTKRAENPDECDRIARRLHAIADVWSEAATIWRLERERAALSARPKPVAPDPETMPPTPPAVFEPLPESCPESCPDCGGSGWGPDRIERGNETVQDPCVTCEGKGRVKGRMEPNSPEWSAAWDRLYRHDRDMVEAAGPYNPDPLNTCVWVYVGTKDGLHTFKHPLHPATGKAETVEVIDSNLSGEPSKPAPVEPDYFDDDVPF